MRPVLIAGANGTLGAAFREVCGSRHLAFLGLSRTELDITDEDAVASALDRHEPWLVVNAAGYVRVDDAERNPEQCRRDNTLGPALLARCCRQRGVRLLCFSSDLVFDGQKGAPYEEDDPPAPLGGAVRTQLPGQ